MAHRADAGRARRAEGRGGARGRSRAPIRAWRRGYLHPPPRLRQPPRRPALLPPGPAHAHARGVPCPGPRRPGARGDQPDPPGRGPARGRLHATERLPGILPDRGRASFSLEGRALGPRHRGGRVDRTLGRGARAASSSGDRGCPFRPARAPDRGGLRRNPEPHHPGADPGAHQRPATGSGLVVGWAHRLRRPLDARRARSGGRGRGGGVRLRLHPSIRVWKRAGAPVADPPRARRRGVQPARGGLPDQRGDAAAHRGVPERAPVVLGAAPRLHRLAPHPGPQRRGPERHRGLLPLLRRDGARRVPVPVRGGDDRAGPPVRGRLPGGVRPVRRGGPGAGGHAGPDDPSAARLPAAGAGAPVAAGPHEGVPGADRRRGPDDRAPVRGHARPGRDRRGDGRPGHARRSSRGPHRGV